MSKYLGIDYGSKRIGLALSDESFEFAFPYSVVLNDSKLISSLEEIIKNNEIERVVIGESKNYLMQDNEIMEEIMDFKDVLEKVFEVDVIFQPEYMTSAQAERIQGKNDKLDASAAAIILQAYLDKQKNGRK